MEFLRGPGLFFELLEMIYFSEAWWFCEELSKFHYNGRLILVFSLRNSPKTPKIQKIWRDF